MPDPVVAAPIAAPAAAPAAVAAPAVPPKPGARDSTAFREVMGREAKLEFDRKALAAERTALKAEQDKVKGYQTAIEKRDLASALKAMGYTDDQVATHIAEKGAGEDPQVLELKTRLAEFERKFGAFETGAKTEAEKVKQAEVQKQNAAYQQTIFDDVYAQADKYPLVANYEQGPAVLAEMATLHKQGVPLGPDLIAQAAANVEARLGEKIDPAYERLAKSPSISKRLIAALEKQGFTVTAKGEKPAATKAPVQPQQVTITNTKAAKETPAAPPEKKKRFNPDDAWREISQRPKV